MTEEKKSASKTPVAPALVALREPSTPIHPRPWAVRRDLVTRQLERLADAADAQK